jgi:hypothetical protein
MDVEKAIVSLHVHEGIALAATSAVERDRTEGFDKSAFEHVLTLSQARPNMYNLFPKNAFVDKTTHTVRNLVEKLAEILPIST